MSGDNLLAFVVEDDRDVAQILAEALHTAGYDTELYHDGLGALDGLAQAVPQIVLLDLQLPEITGEEILLHIRAHQRLADTRVVIVTGEQQLARSVERMADLVLLKPVSFDQVRDLALRLRPSTDE
jgi:DNA-binding response OmpR family regulator